MFGSLCDFCWLLEYVPPERSTGGVRGGAGVCAYSEPAQTIENKTVRNDAVARKAILAPIFSCTAPSSERESVLSMIEETTKTSDLSVVQLETSGLRP
jgi:hypothetical protein